MSCFDFCLNIKGFTKNKYHSWGGTLFDIDADGDLDLWVSRTGKQPTIYLGNNTGKFSSDKNEVTLISADGVLKKIPSTNKAKIAKEILDLIYPSCLKKVR